MAAVTGPNQMQRAQVHVSVEWLLVLHSLWNWGSGTPGVMLPDNAGSIRAATHAHTRADVLI